MLDRREIFFWTLTFLAGVLTTCFVYSPGLKGGFLFDDYPNLYNLGLYGGVVDWETFKSFVFNGSSGPTGRPLSLASFLIDDNTWPSNGQWFKSTNLKIHLLTGIFICWSTLLLSKLFNINEKESAWIGLISALIWLLHPYMVSTTLYVVQRMAQLAAMFMAISITGYCYGRLMIKSKRRNSYIIMSLSVGLGTTLALVSKENGVLVPLLVLVVEACLPANKGKLNIYWKSIFLYVPSFIIIAALASKIDLAPDAWTARSYNQIERVLTEPRILWEYLAHLLVPRIEGRGLYQDGYQISKSLFNPISTFFSLVALISALVLATRYRKKKPVFCFPILFYFAAHLIESSVIALELYFEHRNYAAAMYLFLPIAYGIVQLKYIFRPRLFIVLILIVLSFLSVLTWKRTDLWKNSYELELYWASINPDSPRSAKTIAASLYTSGKVEESMKYLENAMKHMPDSGLLTMRLLLQKVYIGEATKIDFIAARDRLANQSFDPQAIHGIRLLVDFIFDKNVNRESVDGMFLLITGLQRDERYQRDDTVVKLLQYGRSRMLLLGNHTDEALLNYKKTVDLYRDIDSSLGMVVDFVQKQKFNEAIKLLEYSKSLFIYQPESTLKRSRYTYKVEIRRLERQLLEKTGKAMLELGE